MERAPPDWYSTAPPPPPTPVGGGPGSRALVVTAHPGEVTALQVVLARLGLRVGLCPNAGEALERAKAERPALVFVDAAGGGNLPELARILARHPPTASTAVLAIAPVELDRATALRLAAAEVFAILRRPLTAGAVREAARSALTFHLELARRQAAQPSRRRRRVPGHPGLIAEELRCAFHDPPVPVWHHALRAGLAWGDADAFDLPRHRQTARRGAAGPDADVVGVVVCPACLFASNNRAHFATPGDAAAPPAAPPSPAVVAARREFVAARLGRPGHSFFGPDRTPAEALVAYELAVAASMWLYEAAPLARADELARAGDYELLSARLRERYHLDPARAADHRRAAAARLARATAASTGPAIYRAAYQLVSLHLRGGDAGEAVAYLTLLEGLLRRPRRDVRDPAVLESYARRAQALWAGFASTRGRVGSGRGAA